MSKLRVVAVAVALSVIAPAAAVACLNTVVLRGDKAVKEIRKAEAQLKAGKLTMKLREFSAAYEFTDPRLAARALRIEHVAQMRYRNGTSMHDGEPYSARALAYFRAERAAHPDDPIVQALLAEALLTPVDGHATEEAHTLMEDLVTRDLVPDAAAWVVFASLSDRLGDSPRRDEALARCKKIKATARALPCKVLGS